MRNSYLKSSFFSFILEILIHNNWVSLLVSSIFEERVALRGQTWFTWIQEVCYARPISSESIQLGSFYDFMCFFQGELVQDKPIVSKVVDVFVGFFSVIMLFFRTLLEVSWFSWPLNLCSIWWHLDWWSFNFQPLIGADTRRTQNYRPDGRGGGRGGQGDQRSARTKRIGGFGDFQCKWHSHDPVNLTLCLF